MGIYALREGLFDRFKKKKTQPRKEDIELENKIKDHVSGIVDKHKNAYKDIVAKTFSKCPKGFKVLYYHDMIPDMDVDSGDFFGIDFCQIEDDELATHASILMYECVRKLNEYNKRNNILYIEFFVHDDYVGYDIDRDAVIKAMNNGNTSIKNESTIFSGIVLI